jgi:biotin transport system substrate-specific component
MREKSTIQERIPLSLSITRRKIWLIPLFALFTAAGAFLRVYLPGTPVPLTMQTFCVLIAGGVGGAVIGVFSQALYLGLGLCGLPFFAGSMYAGGTSLSPTFGYLIGFLFASALMGMGKGKTRELWSWILRGIGATVIIYLFGISYIALFTAGDIHAAVQIGVYPFILWDMLKVISAAYLIVKLNHSGMLS